MRFSLVLAGTLLSSCASAPPSGPGELGLAGLRRALGLAPVVGHVERSGAQAWLVHDPSGVRIARVPTLANGRCSSDDQPTAVAFEGDPGAVLTFEFGEVHVWQATDATCTISAALFAPSEPEWEVVATLDPSELDTGHPGEAAAVLALASASIDLPGLSPITIELTPTGGTLRHGPDSQTLDLPKGDLCGVTLDAAQASGPDGATWVQLSYTVHHKSDLDACEDGLGDEQYESTGRLRVEVARNGRMRVIESETVPLPLSEEVSDLNRRVPLPGSSAYLEYQENTRQSWGREGPSAISQWSWTLVVGERHFLLAELQ